MGIILYDMATMIWVKSNRRISTYSDQSLSAKTKLTKIFRRKGIHSSNSKRKNRFGQFHESLGY